VESPRETLHIEGMKKSTNAPVMTARELKDGSGWYVLFEWPNGRTRGARRRTWRSARLSAAAMSSNDAILPARIASIQPRERAIARNTAGP
jgi:hypothetical protein